MLGLLTVFQLIFFTRFENEYDPPNFQVYRKNAFSNGQIEQLKYHG